MSVVKENFRDQSTRRKRGEIWWRKLRKKKDLKTGIDPKRRPFRYKKKAVESERIIPPEVKKTAEKGLRNPRAKRQGFQGAMRRELVDKRSGEGRQSIQLKGEKAG